MRNGNRNPHGVAMGIERRRKDMTEGHMNKVFLFEPGPNTVILDEMVNSRIRRLRAFLSILEESCNKIATEKGKGSPEWQMENTEREAVGLLTRIEVWDHYPELIGNTEYRFYEEWAIGYEKTAETGDLFRPAEAKKVEVRTRDVPSTRADTVNLGAVRRLGMTQ